MCVCYIQFAGDTSVMLYSDVEANSVLLVADDDTTSTESPTRRKEATKRHTACGTAGETYVSTSKCGCFGSAS